MQNNIGTTIREYFELKYGLPFNYSELSPRLKQEAYHLYHTKGGRNLVSMWVQKEKTRIKWESFGLLDGLKGLVKGDIANLYESMAVQILNEGRQADPFESKPFPVIQRAFNKIREQEDALKVKNSGHTN